MDACNAILNWVFGWYYAAFSWAPALGLTVISVLSGVIALWIIGRVGNPGRVTAVKRKAQAHLMELLIFDEPQVIWKAQKALLASNLNYMGQMLIPALIISIPLTAIMARVDSYYGHAPLPVGKETVVTLALQHVEPSAQPPSLVAPEGIVVETPAALAVPLREVSWRIRPVASVSGFLTIQYGNETIQKAIEAGGRPRRIAGERTATLWKALRYPAEPRISAAGVDAVTIDYPEAEVGLLGVRAHWLVWSLLISMLAGLLLKKRMGVVL